MVRPPVPMMTRACRTGLCAVLLYAGVSAPLTARAQTASAPPTTPPAAAPSVTAPSPAAPAPVSVPVAVPEAAAAGCVKDTECKGDRICVAGRCVAPSPAPEPVAPQPETSVLRPAPSSLTPGVVVGHEGAVPAAPPPTMVVLYTPPSEDKVSTTGLTFGLRLGVGFPMGPAVPPTSAALGGASTGLVSDVVQFIVPVTADLGYRLSPHWYVGGYLSVGYGPGANCMAGGTGSASCYDVDIRFGASAEYNFLPGRRVQPWLGAGFGWEILNDFESDGTPDDAGSGSADGIEFAHIAAGFDVRLSDRSRIGPYFETTFAEYDNGLVHEWFIVGGRWRYDTNWWKR